jgi:GNAT superfamily N-acetyltransferase
MIPVGLTGLSLIAESPDGDVVGACLNACHVPGHLDETDAEAESCPNPKFQKILRLLASVERQADVFGKFPEVSELLEIRIVAVDALWRGKGVATALLKQTKLVFCVESIFNDASSSNSEAYVIVMKLLANTGIGRETRWFLS